MMRPVTRCRTCGHIGYRLGPCHVCAVYGRYEPTDRIEVRLLGTTGKLERELARWKREAVEFRRLYQSARHEEDALRVRVLRMERVSGSLGRWMREMGIVREGMK